MTAAPFAIDSDTAKRAAQSLITRGYAVIPSGTDPLQDGTASSSSSARARRGSLTTAESLRAHFAMFGAFRDRKPNKGIIERYKCKQAANFEDVTGFHVPAGDTSRLNLVFRGGKDLNIRSLAAGGEAGAGSSNAAEKKLETFVGALDVVQTVSHGISRTMLRNVADLLIGSDPKLVQIADALPMLLEHPSSFSPSAKLPSLTSTTAQFYDVNPTASGSASGNGAGAASSSSSSSTGGAVSFAVPAHIDCSLLTIIYLDGSDDRLEVFDQVSKQWLSPLNPPPPTQANGATRVASGAASSSASQAREHVVVLCGELLAEAVNHLTSHSSSTVRLQPSQHRVMALPDESEPRLSIVTRCMPDPEIDRNLYATLQRFLRGAATWLRCENDSKDHACSSQTMLRQMIARIAIAEFREAAISVNVANTPATTASPTSALKSTSLSSALTPPSPSPSKLVLIVRNGSGDEASFRMNPFANLSRLFATYEALQGVERGTYSYVFAGLIMTPDKRPVDFEMQDGDFVEAMQSSRGD